VAIGVDCDRVIVPRCSGTSVFADGFRVGAILERCEEHMHIAAVTALLFGRAATRPVKLFHALVVLSSISADNAISTKGKRRSVCALGDLFTVATVIPEPI
jgi:hypothetical protein